MVSNSLLTSSSDVAGIPSTKRKRKVVSIEKKLEICRRHEMGQSYTSLSKEYGLGKSTIHDIVQSEDRLTEYAIEIQHASGPKRSIIRRSKYDELDKALHLWFLQKRAIGTPVSGPILTAKAKIFYEKLYGSGDSSVTDTSDTSENSKRTCFKASSGWLAKFKARHGIRKLSCEGESLSASSDDVEPFKIRLSNIIEEEGYTMHQLFNCDETGLNWKMLQDTTLADGSERSARGFKVSKERVTLLATANASGDFRLPLVVIHKYINPRALKHCNLETLPVDYYGQKKAWMDSSIFKNWQSLYQGLSTI